MRHAAMILVVALFLSVLSARTAAQSAEELVSKNIQAKGGMEKI